MLQFHLYRSQKYHCSFKDDTYISMQKKPGNINIKFRRVFGSPSGVEEYAS